MAPKLSCSELKKLQVKRRRLMTAEAASTETTKSLKSFPSLPGMASTDDSENVAPANPFAKQNSTTIASSTSALHPASDSSFCVATAPSSTGDFFDTDFLHGLEKPKMKSSTESTEDDQKPPATAIQSSRVEKSLKTSVIIESSTDLSPWQREIANPKIVHRVMRTWTDDNVLLYYRYPDSPFPAHQKKLIHKAINYKSTSKSASSADETLHWYRQFSENWRKALLSAFEGLKMGTISSFYFLQDGMTVLFERNSTSLKAYLKLSSLALEEDFQTNGISYKIINSVNSEALAVAAEESKAEAQNDKEEECPSDESDTESAPTNQFYLKKRPQARFIKRDILLEGALTLAELVDYLINQKNRHSFAILPEICAPGPFVHGTLQRNELTVSGSCRTANGQTVHQLRLQGIIFPRNLNHLIHHLIGPEHISSLTPERHPLTDFLSLYAQEQ